VRTIVTRLGLVLFGIVFSALLIEGAVRLLVTTVTPSLMQLDDELGWKHRANARRKVDTEGFPAVVDINVHGLRGPVYRGPSARTRVLVLGDSLADGLQVSNAEVFSSRWQALRPDLEIVNTAVAAYGTVQQKLVAARWEPIVRPDLTVLMVFAGNDLTDNVMPFDHAIGPRPYIGADGRERPLDWEPFRPVLLPVPGAAWLHRHSLAAYLVHRRLVAEHGAEYVAAQENALPLEMKWAVLERLLSEIAVGRRLTVVALPTREDVRDGRDGFSRRLEAIAARLGVDFVDLQPVLRPGHFFRRDFHWNAAGHEAVGVHLAAVIE
jgi:hypothetical protein